MSCLLYTSKGLQNEINKKRREANQLNARIDKLIAEEIERARKLSLIHISSCTPTKSFLKLKLFIMCFCLKVNIRLLFSMLQVYMNF